MKKFTSIILSIVLITSMFTGVSFAETEIKGYVPISAALEPVLRQALDEMKSNPEGLIFFDHSKKNRKGSPYKNGGLVETSQVNCFFKRICKKAGIDANFGQHSLRHTFATRLINGVKQPDGSVKALSVKQVAELLGHTTSEITEIYYVKRDNSRLAGLTDSFNL